MGSDTNLSPWPNPEERQKAWDEFKEELAHARGSLEDPFLMYNDGARILDLMSRLSDLLYRDGFKGNRP